MNKISLKDFSEGDLKKKKDYLREKPNLINLSFSIVHLIFFL